MLEINFFYSITANSKDSPCFNISSCRLLPFFLKFLQKTTFPAFYYLSCILQPFPAGNYRQFFCSCTLLLLSCRVLSFPAYYYRSRFFTAGNYRFPAGYYRHFFCSCRLLPLSCRILPKSVKKLTPTLTPTQNSWLFKKSKNSGVHFGRNL